MIECRGCPFYKGEHCAELHYPGPVFIHVHHRSADDEDFFPDDLKIPLGRADHVLDDAALAPVPDLNHDSKSGEESSPQQEAPDKPPIPVGTI